MLYKLVAIESIAIVTIADNIATNPVKGNLCHGFSFKQLDDNMSNESGSTCMNPVARMIPAANALTITKRLRSGFSAGIERVTNGRHTPIILVTKMENMAMIFKGNALDLLTHELFSSAPQSSTTDKTRGAKIEMRMKMIAMCLIL